MECRFLGNKAYQKMKRRRQKAPSHFSYMRQTIALELLLSRAQYLSFGILNLV